MVKELKEIREENEVIKSKFNAMEKKVEYMENRFDSLEKTENEKLEDEDVAAAAADPENVSKKTCEKCEFVAKSDAGLKTHQTVKHNTSIMRAYSKVSR